MDALSRLPDPSKPKNIPVPQEIVMLLNYLDAGPLKIKQISQASRNDPVISRVIKYVLTAWPKHVTDPSLLPYFNRKDELHVSVEQDCLLWGARVIVPRKYQRVMLHELQDNHPGIIKMKALSRSYVWWPSINQEIETTVKECESCQIHGNNPQASPRQPWEWSEIPWKRLHIDFAGPYENKMILVNIDSGTKFIEAHVMNSATSESTINRLHQTFATHGLPESIVSDNGPQFTSHLFSEFCTNNGMKHITVSPYKPASNGMAERAVQTIKNGLKKNKKGETCLETRLYLYLLFYNKIPQSTTLAAPCELLMKRKIRSRIDLIRPI